MSLDYALPKKFPHKLALIDVQFWENVSTRYLWHVLFVWRLLMWKKKSFQKRFKCCFLCLQNGESHGLCVFGKPSVIFLVKELVGDLKSRVNVWSLLVQQLFPHSLSACRSCVSKSQRHLPQTWIKMPSISNEAKFPKFPKLPSPLPSLWEKHIAHKY